MDVATATLAFTLLCWARTSRPHSRRSFLTTQLRMVKSPAEIASSRSDRCFHGVATRRHAPLSPGRERTIAGVEVGAMLAEGCERVSYPAIVGSGVNSTTLTTLKTAGSWLRVMSS